jgi:hypothetical protein
MAASSARRGTARIAPRTGQRLNYYNYVINYYNYFIPLTNLTLVDYNWPIQQATELDNTGISGYEAPMWQASDGDSIHRSRLRRYAYFIDMVASSYGLSLVMTCLGM